MILRYGLLVFGIILTAGYYLKLGVSIEANTWGIISIIIGAIVAYRNPAFGFGKGAGSLNGIGTTLYGKRDVEPDGSYIATKWFIFFVANYSISSLYRILPE